MKHLLSILMIFSSIVLFSQSNEKINQLDSNNRKQGYWIVRNIDNSYPKYSDNQKIEEGNYKDSWKVGLWKSYYPNGKPKSEIHYDMGRPMGKYKLYYENGQLEEAGNWKRTKNTGDFKRYYPNGKLMQDFSFTEAGLRTGEQKYYYSNGNLRLQGNWENGKESGLITEYYENGDISSKKQFSNGELNKNNIQVFAPKQSMPEKSEDTGKKIVVKVNEKEKPNQGGFDGTGYKKLYNSDKQIAKEGYFEDYRLMNGRFYRYNEDGILIQILVFKNGQYIGDGILADEEQ